MRPQAPRRICEPIQRHLSLPAISGASSFVCTSTSSERRESFVSRNVQARRGNGCYRTRNRTVRRQVAMWLRRETLFKRSRASYSDNFYSPRKRKTVVDPIPIVPGLELSTRSMVFSCGVPRTCWRRRRGPEVPSRLPLTTPPGDHLAQRRSIAELYRAQP